MSDASADIAAGALAALLASMVVAAYLLGFAGLELMPELTAGLALGVSAAWCAQVLRARDTASRLARASSLGGRLIAWALVVIATGTGLVVLVGPGMLPPGGGSDLAHHLALVDVLERTRHLVDAGASGPALGEMAHYTPGLHLLVVIAGALSGGDGFHAAYPVVLATIALKAGFLFLIAHDVLRGVPGRTPLAMAAAPIVLFAPAAYSVDGFLRHGFLAQVGAELFAVAGWWALGRWWATRRAVWMAFVGLMGAATFLVWPIWIGPLMFAAATAVLLSPLVHPALRLAHATIAVAPVAIVAALHVSRHAAWLRMAGASGAVPAFEPDVAGWILLTLAAAGLALALRAGSARVTLCFLGGLVLQGLALYGLARLRGAGTPYMAMKMIYLGVYPVAVLAILAIGRITERLPPNGRRPAAWAGSTALLLGAARIAWQASVPAPIVSPDLYQAGRWARASLDAACVGYIVENAEQAYWLHLAVMGQSRSSPRTAELDGYTANRAAGRWIEGTALPYAVARRDLLPGEVLREAEVLRGFGTAVVIRRPGAACRY